MKSILRKSAAVLGALAVAGTLSSVTPAASGAAAPKAPTKVTVNWDVDQEGDVGPLVVKIKSDRAACKRFRKFYILREGNEPTPARLAARGGTEPEIEGFVEGLALRTNARGVWRFNEAHASAGKWQAIALPKRGCEAGFSRTFKVDEPPVER